jgi:TldD protein
MDIKDKLIKLVEAPPVDYLEIRLEEYDSSAVTYSGRELEEIGEKAVKGGCVRACHKGGWGFCSFNLDTDLDKAVREAVDQSRLIGRKETRLTPPPPVTGSFVQSFGADPARAGLEEKKEAALRYNRLLLDHPAIVTSRVAYLDYRKKVVFASSYGSCIEQQRTFTGMTLSAIARDGANVQRAYYSVGDHRGFHNAAGLEDKAEAVKRRAVDLLSAAKPQGGRTTVILDPKLSGVFAHEAFGHLSEADFIFENPRIAEKMKSGARFGPDILNIYDDPSGLAECGGYAYDDEGTPGRRTPLIREGRLQGHLHSMETAGEMGAPLTGNARALNYHHKPIVRMSCTFIEAGATPFEEMISGIRNGIYAVGMLGGNTDLEQFTFSAEYAFEIKDGHVGRLLRDVILTGNVFETLSNIEQVGSDFRMFGGMGGCGKEGQSPLPVSDGGPHLRIRNVLIG